MNDKFKEIHIKNVHNTFSINMINTKNLDPDEIKIDEK